MKWTVMNIIGLMAILGLAFRFQKEGTAYIAQTGNTASQLYGVVSLQSPASAPSVTVR